MATRNAQSMRALRAHRRAAGRVPIRAEVPAALRAWIDTQAESAGESRAEAVERLLRERQAAGGRISPIINRSTTMSDCFAQLSDGTFYGMSDRQELLARRAGAHTIAMDDGSWGWECQSGHATGFGTELEAWADAIQTLEDDDEE